MQAQKQVPALAVPVQVVPVQALPIQDQVPVRIQVQVHLVPVLLVLVPQALVPAVQVTGTAAILNLHKHTVMTLQAIQVQQMV